MVDEEDELMMDGWVNAQEAWWVMDGQQRGDLVVERQTGRAGSAGAGAFARFYVYLPG
jgi:hypothetical protein